MMSTDKPLFPPLLVVIHSVSTLEKSNEIQDLFRWQNLRTNFTLVSSKRQHLSGSS